MKRGRVWLRAGRPATLSAAVTPVLVGSALAARVDSLRWPVLAAALAGAVLIQVGANYANDLFDFQRGADGPRRLGPPRATATGQVSPRGMAIATAVVLAASVACGAYLVAVGGPVVVAVGLASIVAALAYVGGPWPYGYRGLGDPACFVFFGAVPILTLEWLHSGVVSAGGCFALIAVGALVTAILVVNNLRDIDEGFVKV